MNVKLSSLILDYKGWFNLHTLPGEIDIVMDKNGKIVPVELDASKLKWYITTEVYDKNFEIKTIRDEELGEECPVIEYIPFKGTLTGTISVNMWLDCEYGVIQSGVVKETPNGCALVGFTLESSLTNKHKR